MRVNSLTRLLALAALLGGATAAHRASAASIFFDNFESYGTQAALNATWVPVTTQLTYSTAQASSPTHSVQSAANAAAATQRARRTFSETGNVTSAGDKLVWSFDYYDVGTTAAASPFRQYGNLQDSAAPSATNQLISMGLNNNQTGANSGGNYFMARILGYTNPAVDPDGGPNESVTGAAIYVKLNDFGVGLRNAAAGWRNLAVVISTNDGLSTDYEFYVDGLLAERVSNVGTAASIRSYDNITLGSGLSSAQGVFFDNAKLQKINAVPEPSTATMVLAGVGLLAAGIASRRRAA